MNFQRPLTIATSLLLMCGAACAEEIDLTPRRLAGHSQTVTVHLEIGGDLDVGGQPEQSETAADGEQHAEKLPIIAVADVEYDEVLLDRGKNARHAARYYRQVTANLTVGDKRSQPELRASRKLMLATTADDQMVLGAVDGPFTRGELDLVQLPADGLVVDQLLPGKNISLGESWRHSAEDMQALVDLDSVGLCEVSSVLAEANDLYARCQIAGAVHGVADGASTELELDGVYLFDRREGRITQLNLAIREQRAVGPARPGWSGVAKLRFKAETTKSSAELSPAVVARVAKLDVADVAQLEILHPRLGFVTTHDAEWFETASKRDEITLRCVATEGLVAHCNIARLPAKPLDPSRALDEFRSDVARAIGEAMTGVASDEQWTNQHGCRVLGVVAEGEVAGAAIEWHSYLVAPAEDSPATHRLALTFTVEKSELERLAGRDRQLVDHLKMPPIAERSAKQPVSRK